MQPGLPSSSSFCFGSSSATRQSWRSRPAVRSTALQPVDAPDDVTAAEMEAFMDHIQPSLYQPPDDSDIAHEFTAWLAARRCGPPPVQAALATRRPTSPHPTPPAARSRPTTRRGARLRPHLRRRRRPAAGAGASRSPAAAARRRTRTSRWTRSWSSGPGLRRRSSAGAPSLPRATRITTGSSRRTTRSGRGTGCHTSRATSRRSASCGRGWCARSARHTRVTTGSSTASSLTPRHKRLREAAKRAEEKAAAAAAATATPSPAAAAAAAAEASEGAAAEEELNAVRRAQAGKTAARLFDDLEDGEEEGEGEAAREASERTLSIAT
ncbi:hypothetical protein EMIHUDRAFT_369449, partial [Emiliania huxleyi CCMP1516]|uniref:Uncharacterized protein n=2 Tax=Emiliania huxleyi TaxID=2903 RepID=A0A0D3J819_EMIH1